MPIKLCKTITGITIMAVITITIMVEKSESAGQHSGRKIKLRISPLRREDDAFLHRGHLHTVPHSQFPTPEVTR